MPRAATSWYRANIDEICIAMPYASSSGAYVDAYPPAPTEITPFRKDTPRNELHGLRSGLLRRRQQLAEICRAKPTQASLCSSFGQIVTQTIERNVLCLIR